MKTSSLRQPLAPSSLPSQKGFTLIELIMVIALLGILAVVAIPKYQDLKSDAADAQADGVFGAAQGAAAVNFANNLVNTGGTLVTTGATLLGAMDGTPDGWSAVGDTITATINGTAYTITVTTDETASAKAVLTKSW